MSLDTILRDRQVEADPFSVPSSGDSCGGTPSTFNVREMKNFFDKPVPLEFSIYTKVPDSLLNALIYFDLDGKEMKLLLYIHKLTLGYINHTQSYHTQQAKKMPMNTVHVAYGKFSEQGNKAIRNRFVKVTVRQLAKVLRVPKSTLHRRIKRLEQMKLIQVITNQYTGTNIGINYFTLESTFSQTPAFKTDSTVSHLDLKMENGLLKKDQDTDTYQPALAIENMVKCLGASFVFEKNQVNPIERLLLMGVFKQNMYLEPTG